MNLHPRRGFRGEYLFWDLNKTKHQSPLVLPNLIPNDGETEFLKMIFQNVSAVAGGTNFYVGLCDQVPTEALLLSGITTEPTGAGGYARRPLIRNSTDWPTIATVNGHLCITSVPVTFTATGADYSRTFSRFFLTSAASGGTGKLYSVSGPLVSPLLILAGASYAAAYRLYMN